MSVGNCIKEHRMERKLSLRKLAEKAGLSPSMVSQIESGKVDPSLSTLRNLALTLDVPLFYLVLEDHSASNRKVKLGEGRKVIFPDDGLEYEILHSDQKSRMGINIGTLQQGGRTSEGLLPHDGEECLIILEGHMEVVYEHETVHLTAGESLYFDSSVPHRLQNTQPEPCRFYLIISPPKF
ncbi:MAG: cupin domain-containing protein [Desulfopila sp.]